MVREALPVLVAVTVLAALVVPVFWVAYVNAVGLIEEPEQADEIIRAGRADLVLMARAFLRDPYWLLHAAQALEEEAPVPVQYGRAFVKPRKKG